MKKKVTLVLPYYNEEKNLPILYGRLREITSPLPYDFEFLFINDGSTDGSTDFVLKQVGENSDICLLELSRNFGHQTAVYAGLQHANGEAVIIMDTDLQDRPEVIRDFIQKWEEGAHVVYAIRTKRKENPIKRFFFYMFYKILNGLSSIPIPVEAGMFSLMDRQVVNLLANIPERNRFIPGLRAWVGFNQVGIPVERDERGDRIPRVSFIQLVRLATDAIISFSWIPLRISTILGIVAAFLSIVGTCIVLYKKFISLEAIPGWTSTLLSIFFFGAIQLIIFGIIGEYLGRIYEEVKRRPPYVVRKVIGRSSDETLRIPDNR
jgi:dolichol-phosphate mannosyltransferase